LAQCSIQSKKVTSLNDTEREFFHVYLFQALALEVQVSESTPPVYKVATRFQNQDKHDFFFPKVTSLDDLDTLPANYSNCQTHQKRSFHVYLFYFNLHVYLFQALALEVQVSESTPVCKVATRFQIQEEHEFVSKQIPCDFQVRYKDCFTAEV
jgi:hypothetical protein